MKTKLLVVLLLLCPIVTQAKVNSSQGIRPFISIKKSLAPKWTLGAFYADTVQLSTPAKDLQSYLEIDLSYKKSPKLAYWVGYVYQRNNPWTSDYSNENRLIQQLTYSVPCLEGTVTQRFRIEERFIQNRLTGDAPLTTRFRYRVFYAHTMDKYSVDGRNVVFEAYNEAYFNTTFGKTVDLNENWVYAGISYRPKDANHTFKLGPLFEWKKSSNIIYYLLQGGVSIRLP